jgi:hypothetical protein
MVLKMGAVTADATGAAAVCALTSSALFIKINSGLLGMGIKMMYLYLIYFILFFSTSFSTLASSSHPYTHTHKKLRCRC